MSPRETSSPRIHDLTACPLSNGPDGYYSWSFREHTAWQALPLWRFRPSPVERCCVSITIFSNKDSSIGPKWNYSKAFGAPRFWLIIANNGHLKGSFWPAISTWGTYSHLEEACDTKTFPPFPRKFLKESSVYPKRTNALELEPGWSQTQDLGGIVFRKVYTLSKSDHHVTLIWPRVHTMIWPHVHLCWPRLEKATKHSEPWGANFGRRGQQVHLCRPQSKRMSKPQRADW